MPFEHYGIDDLVCMDRYAGAAQPPRPPWAPQSGRAPTWFPCSFYPLDACQREGTGPRAPRMTLRRPCRCAPGGRPVVNPYARRPGARRDPHARSADPTVADYAEAFRAQQYLRRFRE